jgi:hypothetical protein
VATALSEGEASLHTVATAVVTVCFEQAAWCWSRVFKLVCSWGGNCLQLECYFRAGNTCWSLSCACTNRTRFTHSWQPFNSLSSPVGPAGNSIAHYSTSCCHTCLIHPSTLNPGTLLLPAHPSEHLLRPFASFMCPCLPSPL